MQDEKERYEHHEFRLPGLVVKDEHTHECTGGSPEKSQRKKNTLRDAVSAPTGELFVPAVNKENGAVEKEKDRG